MAKFLRNSIVSLANGDFVVTGTTMSSAGSAGEDFPAMMFGTNTSDKVNDVTLDGNSDIFITKFGNNNAIKWCRYLGGSGDETQGMDFMSLAFNFEGPGNSTVAVGNSLYLTGRVQNGFTPLKGQGCEHYYGSINGTFDACLTLINDQNVVTFSTYWGGTSGSNDDQGLTISKGMNGVKPFVLFGGSTNSGGGSNQTIPVCFESADAYYNNNLMNAPPVYDGFISKLYLDCQLVATIERENVQSIELAPNPASNMINLELDQEGDIPQSIHVFDASGRDCSYLISTLSNDSSLDVHRLPAGLYFVQIQYKDKLAVGRFVKM